MRDRVRFKDVYLTTASVYDDNVAVLVLSVNADLPAEYLGKCRLKVFGQCGEHTFQNDFPLTYNAVTVFPYVGGAKLW